MMEYDTQTHEREEDPNRELVELQSKWIERLDAAEKASADFFEEAKRALKWLRIDKDSRKRRAGGEKLNVAFANYEVLRSTVYSRPPQIVVQPRFGGGPARDQLTAVSAVMERATGSEIERQDLHSSLKMARDELLKVGRGVLWVRYKADLQEQGAPDQEMAPEAAPPAIKIKTGERIEFDVVTWRNFLHGPAKRWREVPWISRTEDMSRDEIKERFSLDKSAQDALGLEFGEPDDRKAGAPKTTDDQTCRVHEVWCKKSGKVYFVARGASRLIEPPSPPLIDVQGFFPCPEPAMSVTQDGEIRPIPDVIMIEDQLVSIDRLTARITALENALKVRGFYPKGATDTTAADAVEEAIRSNDNRQVLIPVPAFAAGNGAKLDVVWLPLDVVVQAITALRQQRQEAIELVYQITGISDVMRGASEASETLGAQQIKDRWGGVRVRDKQEEMRRLARDACRIAAEIICELFDPETIAKASVYGFDPAMMSILRDDRARSLTIDIETDSTIQADEQEEKQRATEFVTATGSILMQGVQIAQAAPELVPLIGATLKFVASKHRAGREMESEIEKAVTALTARTSAPPEPPKEDPAIAIKREEMALRREEMQQNAVIAREKMESDAATKREIAQMDIDAKREIEGARIADQRMGRDDTLRAAEKPTISLQTNIDGAMDEITQSLREMAEAQVIASQGAIQAMQGQGASIAEAAQAIAIAANSMGSARRRTVRGSNGKTYEITDEAT